MTKQIEQITFLEITDFEFKVQFAYSSKVLQTKAISRTATEAEILLVIKDAIQIFDSNYNEQAFNAMVAKYSGKSLVIN